ncbi:MAG: glycosyl hydrolase 115 family protein [Clostridia bacterium]|nr:glycosyl hydrolase 115 family protein [Clostridia bacterium]
MMITRSTRILGIPELPPVKRAAAALQRDIKALCLPGGSTGTDIRLQQTELPPEAYLLSAGDDILLQAGDALGFVYGLYRISHDLLGVNPFWFWNDQSLRPLAGYAVPSGWTAASKPCAVRYRGWFINDEVLLHTWSLDGSKDKPWEMVFEALLRLGGNLVIPGTDRNAHIYDTLAAEYGLYITHHHAEPLGARMFLRAYPDLTPSYAEHPGLFEGLWQEAVDKQKSRPTVYNLGFRGQGDRPFWADDPQYATPESRGALMSRLIRQQYDLVKANVPEAPCCTNLYGESMELYQQGYLDLPKDVIKIWADNGYGKMVTRRQGNHNPRIRALPRAGAAGAHGLYYHASFYDLQAASQMTMLSNPPEFICRELTEALSLGVKDYWIINCSNVKPHVYTLDLIAELWREGNVDPAAHLQAYCTRYYGSDNADLAADCFRAWYKNALPYGEREDEHAGEQFANHCARMLVSQWMKSPSSPAPGMKWAVDAPTLREQIEWYRGKCLQGAANYAAVLRTCHRAMLDMSDPGATLLQDTIAMQAELMMKTFQGSIHAMDSLLLALEGDWLHAFFHAGQAKASYLAADRAMRDREHGRWRLYYANDCQADVKQSAWLMSMYMGVLRNNGDGPHFFQWQRKFIDPPQDAQIMLILNMENHLDNDELFALMQARPELLAVSPS